MNGRYLPDLIQEVIALLPEESGLITIMKLIRENALYCSPEEMQLWWEKFTVAINYNLPYPPILKWQKKIFTLVTQKEI